MENTLAPKAKVHGNRLAVSSQNGKRSGAIVRVVLMKVMQQVSSPRGGQ